MHWFKRNIGDYHKKAGRLTMLQHGAYTLLMDSCYDREQFPTMEEAIEWAWASTPEEVHAVEFVLSRFFMLEDGVYTQSRISDELMQYQSKAETNKRIAIEREAKRKGISTKQHESCTKGERVDNESPPNQEPRTINHKPSLKDLFDSERIIPLWNSLGCEKHNGLTKKAASALEKTFKAYCKATDQPRELNDWIESYLKNGFKPFITDHHKKMDDGKWAADFEFAIRLDTYDKIKNTVR